MNLLLLFNELPDDFQDFLRLCTPGHRSGEDGAAAGGNNKRKKQKAVCNFE
jgi:hypothetical protein